MRLEVLNILTVYLEEVMTSKSNLIKDAATRNAVSDIEKKIKVLSDTKQIPADATLKEVIGIINKLTNNLKRN